MCWKFVNVGEQLGLLLGMIMCVTQLFTTTSCLTAQKSPWNGFVLNLYFSKEVYKVRQVFYQVLLDHGFVIAALLTTVTGCWATTTTYCSVHAYREEKQKANVGKLIKQDDWKIKVNKNVNSSLPN